LVTYAENQLILAEAKHATANDPGALINLNNARAIVPLSPCGVVAQRCSTRS